MDERGLEIEKKQKIGPTVNRKLKRDDRKLRKSGKNG